VWSRRYAAGGRSEAARLISGGWPQVLSELETLLESEALAVTER
jgi:hypothetical protein